MLMQIEADLAQKNKSLEMKIRTC